MSPSLVAAAVILEMCGPMAGVTFVFRAVWRKNQKISPERLFRREINTKEVISNVYT